jgi:hypothetical protein
VCVGGKERKREEKWKEGGKKLTGKTSRFTITDGMQNSIQTTSIPNSLVIENGVLLVALLIMGRHILLLYFS